MHDVQSIQGEAPDLNVLLTDEDGAFDLPAFDENGLLPAVEFDEAGGVFRRGPYGCSTATLRRRFGTSPKRLELIDKLMEYRDALRDSGMRVMFQWVSGPLVERDPEPSSYEVVNFYSPPMHVKSPGEMMRFIQLNHELFVKFFTKPRFGCEPHYVPLTTHPVELIRLVTTSTVLLSHSRPSGLQRGFIVLGGLGAQRKTVPVAHPVA
jgi:hypothetical protein